MKKVRFLGLDVHAETIAVAVAEPDGEVRSLGIIPNREESVRKLVKKLGPAEQLQACYEAGPTGYVVYWCETRRTRRSESCRVHAAMGTHRSSCTNLSPEDSDMEIVWMPAIGLSSSGKSGNADWTRCIPMHCGPCRKKRGPGKSWTPA
jgi:hypothetical protein